jgi:hypothetical protein
MGGWIISKRERYHKKGHESKAYGELVPKLDEQGVETGEYEWQGHYMEGIVQTFGGLFMAAFDTVSGKDRGAFREKATNLAPHQKENIGRFVFDTAIIGLIVSLMRQLFDDEEERNSILAYVALGSMEEAYTLQHMLAFRDFVASPFPAIGIMGNTINGIFSGDVERAGFSFLKYLGIAKVPEQVMRGVDEFKIWN